MELYQVILYLPLKYGSPTGQIRHRFHKIRHLNILLHDAIYGLRTKHRSLGELGPGIPQCGLAKVTETQPTPYFGASRLYQAYGVMLVDTPTGDDMLGVRRSWTGACLFPNPGRSKTGPLHFGQTEPKLQLCVIGLGFEFRM